MKLLIKYQHTLLFLFLFGLGIIVFSRLFGYLPPQNFGPNKDFVSIGKVR